MGTGIGSDDKKRAVALLTPGSQRTLHLAG